MASSSVHSPYKGANTSGNSQRYFTKDPEDKWLFRPPVGTPVTFRNRQYPSATAALDAYISEHENRPGGVHQKYDEDFVNLLVPKNISGGSSSSSRAAAIDSVMHGRSVHSNSSNAQKLAKIRQMVDDSYELQTSSTLNRSSHVMHAVDRDPLPSPSDLAFSFPQRVDSQSTVTTDQLLLSNPLGLAQLGLHPRLNDPHNYRVNDLNLRGATNSRSLDSLLDEGYSKDKHASMSSPGPSSIHLNSTLQGSSGAKRPPSWVNDLEGSDTSSIVTGHFQNGLVNKRHLGTKMASTPKHQTAMSRVGSRNQHKSTAGLEPRDLMSYPSMHKPSPHTVSAKSLSPSQNQYHQYSAKSCLRQASPPKQASSRVSFADDTHLSYHRARVVPRSRSYSAGTRLDGDRHSSISSMTDNLVSYPSSGSKPSNTMSRSVPGFHGIENPEHRKFLQRLMAEIERSSSSVISEFSPSDIGRSSGLYVSPTQQSAVSRQLFGGVEGRADTMSEGGRSQTVEWGSDAASMGLEQGAGYLARIQKLLSSPVYNAKGVPPDSPATDSVLDGDRPWEQHATIKPPIAVGQTPPSPSQLHKYKQDCMYSDKPVSLDQTLTGGSHPGSLEALKQMLFTMQSYADSDDAWKAALEESVLADQTAEESASLSPSTKKLLVDTKHPGGESLNRAMEHLRRLKYLVESDGQMKTSAAAVAQPP